MAAGMKQVWVFRIVHQDTGKPAQGVPVTVLEPSGNAAGYWVSEADGTVAIPRRDTPKLRLRVGLRTEDPIELDTATLGDQPIPLAAPSRLPPTSGGTRDTGERDLQAGSPPPPRGDEDALALMALCFTRREAAHLRSILALVRAGQYRDAVLIARSMIEGVALLTWAAREPSTRSPSARPRRARGSAERRSEPGR